jgi:SPP1 family predicted phage head-tail adaptor
MNPGKLNCRVAIEQPDGTRDALGQHDPEAWVLLDTVWANIRYGSGREAIEADRETASARVSIRIRRRTDVTAAMRVVYEGTVFQIMSVLQDPASKQHTDLVCEVHDG